MAKRRAKRVRHRKSAAKWRTVRRKRQRVGSYERYEPVHHNGYARPKKMRRKMRKMA